MKVLAFLLLPILLFASCKSGETENSVSTTTFQAAARELHLEMLATGKSLLEKTEHAEIAADARARGETTTALIHEARLAAEYKTLDELAVSVGSLREKFKKIPPPDPANIAVRDLLVNALTCLERMKSANAWPSSFPSPSERGEFLSSAQELLSSLSQADLMLPPAEVHQK
jgi:hypothetical protein